jgi:Mce-associated membrane protein
MSSDESGTPVRRRRRIAGERAAAKRPAERPAGRPTPKPGRGGPGRPPAPRIGTPWRPDRRTLAWFVPLCVVAVVAAGLAVGFGIRELRADDEQEQVQAREDAVAPAGQAAEALLSFRYDTLDEELQSERDLMTDAYAEEFLNVFPDQALDLTTQEQATVESTVLAAAPLECGEECSTDTVDVLIFVNTESTVAGAAPEVSPNRAVMTMERDGNTWLVGGIELF